VEIVRRARSRLGENRYRFLSNNCEHFSEWCVNGEHRSPQVECLLAPLRCVAGALNDLLRRLKATPLRRRLQQVCAAHLAQGTVRSCPVIDASFTPHRSLRELRDLIKAGTGIDPLKDFSEAAREEVGTFKFVT
jgi:hypothetical protein